MHTHLVPVAIVKQRQLHKRNLLNLPTLTLPAQISKNIISLNKGNEAIFTSGRLSFPPTPGGGLGQQGQEGLTPGRGRWSKSRSLTAVDPFFTASCAYSTWKRCPSGEKTVIARSYRDSIAQGWAIPTPCRTNCRLQAEALLLSPRTTRKCWPGSPDADRKCLCTLCHKLLGSPRGLGSNCC